MEEKSVRLGASLLGLKKPGRSTGLVTQWRCPGAFAAHLLLVGIIEVTEAKQKERLRALDGLRVSSKSPSRVLNLSRWGVIAANQWFFAIKQLEKNEFVARPEDPQQTIKKSWLKMTRFQILPNRVPAAASKSLQKQRIKAGGCGQALSRWQSRKPDLRCQQF